jgi:hypothetical protein
LVCSEMVFAAAVAAARAIQKGKAERKVSEMRRLRCSRLLPFAERLRATLRYGRGRQEGV